VVSRWTGIPVAKMLESERDKLLQMEQQLAKRVVGQTEAVNAVSPWKLPPLVGGLIGVLFITHMAAYAWTLWDGDWLRTRPIFWQAPITAFLLLLLPLIHPNDLEPEHGTGLLLYYAVAGLMFLLHGGIILSYRSREKRFTPHE